MFKQTDIKIAGTFLNVGLIKHGLYDIFLRKKEYIHKKLKNPPALNLDDSEYHYSVFHEYQRQDVNIPAHLEISREGMASNFLYLLGISTPEIYFYSHSTIYMEMVQDKKTKRNAGGRAIDLKREIKNEIDYMRSLHEVSELGREFRNLDSRDSLWEFIRDPKTLQELSKETGLGYKQYMEMGVMLMMDLCLGNQDRFLGGTNPGNTLIDGTGTLNFIDTGFSAPLC